MHDLAATHPPAKEEDLLCNLSWGYQPGLTHLADEFCPLAVTQVVQGAGLEHGGVNGPRGNTEHVYPCAHQPGLTE